MGTHIVDMDRNTHQIARIIENTAHDSPDDLQANLQMWAVITVMLLEAACAVFYEASFDIHMPVVCRPYGRGVLKR